MKYPFRYLCSAILMSASLAAVADRPVNPEILQSSIDRVVEKVTPATVEVKFVDRGDNSTFSAAIVSSQGHILSAGHAVISNAKYQVMLPDGRRFDAVGLGTEPHIDMGVIKITAPENLPVAEMGWSSNLKRNEPCISLGYPGDHHAERGVVVRFGHIANPAAKNGYIQSTCLMEPGDSGGPLYDMQGRLIAIHSSIRESLDVNYEVPVDQFRRYWNHLIDAKEFHDHNVEVGPDFGFKLIADVSPHANRAPQAKVASVAGGSLAQQSGLQANDRIVAIDGEAASYDRQTRLLLQRAYTMQRSSVKMKIKRADRELMLNYRLPENDSHYSAWRNSVAVTESAPGTKLVEPQDGLKTLSDVFSDREEELESASVTISSQISGKASTAIATLFRPGNILVGKNSLVGDTITVQRNGQIYPAQVIRRDKQRDLVLLKLSKRLKGGIKLSAQNSERISRGELLLSPHPETEGRVGVKSTERFAIGKRSGYLGVVPRSQGGKVVLAEVQPDTPASTEFKNGDFLLAVDGESIHTSDQLIEKLRNYSPGDKVELSAMRNGEEMSVELILGAKPDGGHIAEFFEGGKSVRRDGFSAVFSHDTRLLPQECGGPLFTTDGNFVGINIARFSRTRSYAIPAQEVVDFVNDFRNR